MSTPELMLLLPLAVAVEPGAEKTVSLRVLSHCESFSSRGHGTQRRKSLDSFFFFVVVVNL